MNTTNNNENFKSLNDYYESVYELNDLITKRFEKSGIRFTEFDVEAVSYYLTCGDLFKDFATVEDLVSFIDEFESADSGDIVSHLHSECEYFDFGDEMNNKRYKNIRNEYEAEAIHNEDQEYAENKLATCIIIHFKVRNTVYKNYLYRFDGCKRFENESTPMTLENLNGYTREV